MACRVEMIALHVHGQEADLDAFFDDLEKAMEQKATDAEKIWPSLEFMPPADLADFGLGADESEEDDDGF